jgi:hypothetical protein
MRCTIQAPFIGGMIDFSKAEDGAAIKQRLLSPTATGVRVALLDNLKSLRLSWADLEALITATSISGKQMYVGESCRPNTFLWLLTLNGASLSTDMAQRAVLIKVGPPTRSRTWEEDTAAFILENRTRIIADIVGFYRRPAVHLAAHTRWAAWERDVLSRLPDPEEAQRVIQERQVAADVEEEEGEIIEEYFGTQLATLNYSIDEDRIHIPVAIASRWFNDATNKRETVTATSRMLKQLSDENRFKRIHQSRGRAHGRGFFWVGKDALDGRARFDLRDRIEQNSTYPSRFN